jgi:hypothetical protein
MKALRILFCIALAAAGFAVWMFIVRGQPLAFGANEEPTQQGLPVVLYGYAITVLGVILGATYRELQSRRARGQRHIGSPGAMFRGIFTSIDFWMSLCGSPIVYALLWKSFQAGGIAALTIVALQNGFCCTVILEGVVRRAESP